MAQYGNKRRRTTVNQRGQIYFKEMADRGVDMNEAGLASMTRNIYDMLLKSEDAVEGPKAFAEKRKAQWKGR